MNHDLEILSPRGRPGIAAAPREERAAPVAAPLQPAPLAPMNAPATRQPREIALETPAELNVLIASMAIGGAERCVHDVITALVHRKARGKLFIMYDVVPSYPVDHLGLFKVVRLGGLTREEKLRAIAIEVMTSAQPVLYTHLIRAADLRVLWDFGVTTAPVVHNSAPGWQDRPAAFAHERVPFIVAVSAEVRSQLEAAACPKPVIVLRHELQRWREPEARATDREVVRRRHGIRPDTFLIGMVGQFKAHKAYTRAVRVLREARRFANAKLMILGGWDHDYGAGRFAYTAALKLALELGVLPDVLVLGGVDPVEPYYAAFDLFLNTSIYEGLSIATLEAAQAGCPIVSADVGGQREAVPPHAVLIADPSDVAAYVGPIRRIFQQRQRPPPLLPPAAPDLVPRLWASIARHGVAAGENAGPRHGTLFVTSNLNPGGAQRSLTNLLTDIAPRHRAWLCVLGRVLGDRFITQLEAAGVPSIGLSPRAAQLDRVEDLLELARRLRVRTICFWNVEAGCKLLVAKVHAHSGVRLIDVSPGPMLFAELDAAGELQRRIAFSSSDYLNRLDCFVAKYRGGQPPAGYGAQPRRLAVIPNGVPPPPRRARAAAPLRPPGADPRHAIVTCCRIVPNKRIEWLLEMMAGLATKVPGATLTIVGGVDQRHIGYWATVVERRQQLGLRNVHFAGPNPDVFSFLGQFRVFVMVSDAQGCPNASLEAMAAGLPVVANADGGTGEQVVHGRTGYLVSGREPAEMAERVAALLRAPERARRFGAAGRRRAEAHFGMAAMARRYLAILDAENSR